MKLKLNEEEKANYEWQLDVPGFGEAGQEKLKGATVLVSRCGGLGSVVCYELAAAGVGRLICAHAGNVKPSDLNRQLLMTHDWIGKPRIESIERRLKDLNPRMEIVPVDSNLTPELANELVQEADLCVGTAPLFEERFALNDACVKWNTPLVDCAMHELQAQITTIIPGQSPCLRCLIPDHPEEWKRRFPVFGAVSGTVACLEAMEAIKVLSGLGQPLQSRLLTMDLRSMAFHGLDIERREDCPVCSHL